LTDETRAVPLGAVPVTFTALMLLFSIADTGVKGSGPVVTIPAQ
jgi:hypothetical protein